MGTRSSCRSGYEKTPAKRTAHFGIAPHAPHPPSLTFTHRDAAQTLLLATVAMSAHQVHSAHQAHYARYVHCAAARPGLFFRQASAHAICKAWLQALPPGLLANITQSTSCSIFCSVSLATHASPLTDLPPVCRGAIPHAQSVAANIFFMKIKSIQAIGGWGKSVFH